MTVRLISNKFFFLSAVIIAVVARYPMERGLRTDFLQRRVIDARRAELQARIARLGTELEASVVPAILENPQPRSLKFPSWLSAQRVVAEISCCRAW